MMTKKMKTMTNFNEIEDKYKDDAYLYCRLILDEKILASNAVIAACERHLNDLLKIKEQSFKYSYRPKKAKNAIRFMEVLPDPKTGKTFPLAMFQKFIVGNIHGWYRKGKKNVRRFKTALVMMARKNGKSILIAGLMLYEFLFFKNPQMSRQMFCAGNDKKQASLVFKMVAKFLRALSLQDKQVRKATKKVREEIRNLIDDSFIIPLSRDTSSLDGFEPQFTSMDEAHEYTDDEIFELIESGQGQLESPLTFIISTAGFKLNGWLYTTMYPYAKSILAGNVIDDEMFVFIAEQDFADEWQDETTWIKSNPILEIKAKYEDNMEYLRKRIKTGIEQNKIFRRLVKNFNYWMQASEESYMDAKDWKAAGASDADIYGKDVYIGVDLSKGGDISALGFVFPLEDKNFHVDAHSFVGTRGGLDLKIDRDKIDYRLMVKKGVATLTDLESGIINYAQMIDYIERYVQAYNLNVRAICYDSYNISLFLAELEKRGLDYELIEVRQGVKTLSDPTKEFKLGVIDKRITHSNNALLDIAVNNAILKYTNDACQINKERNREKIDPIVAVIDGFTEAMYYEPTNKELYFDVWG
ncbi:terminase large subunit [Listeria monocytogenes]|nr:terminase large subunit [Listeria monocytogenes]EAF2116390.1 terminase large subunit [Listeria monocytogenes]